MTQNNLGRNCPVCDSKSSQVVKTIEFELFDGHPMNDGYNVVQCDKCGVIFADTPVTQAALDKYYTELSKYEDKNIATGGGYTQNDKNRLAATASFVGKYITDKSARILDLGCANGGLLKELMALGYDNVVGIDPSHECVEITKAEVGCECFQFSIFDIPQHVGKFDLVILSHVLEHVLDVRKTVNIVEGLLNDNGNIYVECPNAEYYKEVIHAPLQEFNTEHINHFTEVAFQNLLGLHGFEKIVTGDKVFQIASDQDYHAVYGLFKKPAAHTVAYAVQFDKDVRPAIETYIEESEQIFEQIRKRLDEIPVTQPIALLGVGQFSFKMLAADAFKNGRTFKLFDNNKLNVGKKIKGVSILHGSAIADEYRKEPFAIVIASLIHEKAIKKGLETLFKDENVIPEIIGFSHLLK